jgi:very-short-patch-repair endonuclease
MRIVERVRSLRKNPTDAEKTLWRYLRNRQLLGFKFYRQMQIGRYVVDFVCREKNLIIEADGGQHNDNRSDEIRTHFLENKGYVVMRFWNNDILQNTQGVLQTIAQALTPTLSLKGEGVKQESMKT